MILLKILLIVIFLAFGCAAIRSMVHIYLVVHGWEPKMVGYLSGYYGIEYFKNDKGYKVWKALWREIKS